MGQRLTVLAEAAVDEDGADGSVSRRPRGPGRAGRARRARGARVGRLGDDDVGLAQQVDRAHGQQVGVTGAVPTKETHPRAGPCRWWLGRWSCLASCVVHPVRSCLVVRRVCRWGPAMSGGWSPDEGVGSGGSGSSSSAATVGQHLRGEPAPSPAGSSVGPLIERRTDSAPSVDSATARTQSSYAVLAHDDLGERADGGGAATLEGGEHGALGLDGGARGGVVERAQRGRRARRRRGTRGRGLLTGGRQHLQRVEHLGHLLEPTDPRQARPREQHGIVSPDRTLPIRVSDVATNAHHVQTETEGVQLRGATRRAGADARIRPAAPRA